MTPEKFLEKKLKEHRINTALTFTKKAILEAIREYGKQEYDRGIEDNKQIQIHGTTNWQE